MLSEVRGAVADRKRKRVYVATEAYPDSEYNLPPTSDAAGIQVSSFIHSARPAVGTFGIV